MKRYSLLLFLFFCIAGFTIPSPAGHVTDLSGVLSAGAKARIETVCRQVKASGAAEFAVLIVDAVEQKDINGYAQAVFDKWKIGEKGKDNGLLMVIAVKDKKIRIQTGYGLEGIMPDGFIGSVIDNEILPFFRKGNYDEGVYRAIVALQHRLTPEGQKKKYEPAVRQKRSNYKILIVLAVILVLVNLIIPRFTGNRRRGGGFWFGGFGGGGFGNGGFGGFGGGMSGGGGADRGW